MWGVEGNNASLAARSEWGTSRMAAPAIAKALLEQRVVQVTDEIDDGRRVVNPVETAAAQEKAEAMQGAVRRVVLGGPGARPAAAGRVQPAVQLDRSARLLR